MFKNLKSIYPLPKGWDGDDDRRKFGVRIQQLFEWVQKSIKNLFTNKSEFIYIPSTTSWSEVWGEINRLENGQTATFTAEASGYSTLSNGARENKVYGTISRRSDTQFNFMLRLNTSSIFAGNLTGATEDGTDRVYAERAYYSEIDTLQSDVANRPYGRRITKSIPGNTNTCRIDFPAGEFLININVPGLSRTWFGLVYVATTGSVSIEKLTGQTGITVTAGTSYITATFTYTTDTTLHLWAMPLRSNTFPSFH